MSEYNGHPSRAHWNVALWIANDEPTYRRAIELLRTLPLKVAARRMLTELPERTGDGVPYTYATVRHALEGLQS